MTLKDFEHQPSILLEECINLLIPFFSSSAYSSNPNDTKLILELCREITLCPTAINELETKITTCEKSQRLSKKVEHEYKNLFKCLYEQLHHYSRTGSTSPVPFHFSSIEKLETGVPPTILILMNELKM